MDKSKYGVHQTHCCIKHGCKYGTEDCPVESGEIRQEYICEECSDDGIESVDEIFDRINNQKILESNIRCLEKQLLDAFVEGKLDTVTYNSMFITLNKIKDSIKNR